MASCDVFCSCFYSFRSFSSILFLKSYFLQYRQIFNYKNTSHMKGWVAFQSQYFISGIRSLKEKRSINPPPGRSPPSSFSILALLINYSFLSIVKKSPIYYLITWKILQILQWIWYASGNEYPSFRWWKQRFVSKKY